MPNSVILKENTYFDSITLMSISSKIQGLDGITSVQVAMGTDHNKMLLKDAGMWEEEAQSASPNDLLIAFSSRAGDQKKAVLELIDQLLFSDKADESSQGNGTKEFKRIPDALKHNPDLNLALISVPGEYAAREAKQALEHGLHVMMFSDNVSIDDERLLKELAMEKDLLMMGPDCGTAIINGKGLGFSNKVKKGNIGIVGASGTGIQESTVLLDRLGLGITHAIGTGGRDLKREIGALTMKQGLRLLEKDPHTEIIVLISKTPDKDVARDLLACLQSFNKPVVVCFMGHFESQEAERFIPIFSNLTDATIHVASLLNVSAEILRQSEVEKPLLQKSQTKIYGLFCGGTLCSEAEHIIGKSHTFIDFGDDEYTKGKPHPMIDPSIRNDAFLHYAKKDDAAVLLFDIVLGYGSHEDPAGNLAPVIRKIRQEKDVLFIASVCGTESDPQVYSRQVSQLKELGVIVASSNANAAELAKSIIQ